MYFTAQQDPFLAQMQGQNHFPDLKYSPKTPGSFLTPWFYGFLLFMSLHFYINRQRHPAAN